MIIALLSGDKQNKKGLDGMYLTYFPPAEHMSFMLKIIYL
jgi:hypothetical protein